MSSSANTTPIRWFVSYRSGFDDPWTLDADLHPDSLETTLLPSMSGCTLSRRYGLMKDVIGGVSTTRLVAPLDLRGKLIRVFLYQGEGDALKSVTWYGYCPQPVDQIMGTLYRTLDGVMTEIHTGRTTYICQGLEHFWAKRVLDRTIFENGTIDDIIPFNRTTDGRLVGNRSASKLVDSYVFTDGPGELWSAADVVEYLVGLWNDSTGLSWTLSGQTSGLATIFEPYAFDESTTFLAALARVVDVAYGYTALVRQTDGDGQPDIHILSILDEAFDAGGVTIPANESVVNLTLNASPIIASARVTHLEDVHYDVVEVRGGPVRSCFTMSLAEDWESMAVGWKSADKTAYDAADDDGRRQGTLRSVYRDFLLPVDWFAEANGVNCIPILDFANLDGAVPVDTAYKQPAIYSDWRLDPFIPFKTTDTDEEPRYREPFAIVEKDGIYFPLATPPEDYTPVGISVLPDRPGLRFHPRYGHQLAKDVFAATTDQDPEIDYRRIYVTVMTATNARLRYELYVTDAGGDAAISAVPRRKLVMLPDAELWYVAAGTVTDINSDGTSRVTQPNDNTRIVRNDMPRLKALAYALSVWFGRRRSKIDVTYNEPHLLVDASNNHRLGQVVKETDTGGSVEPTGTIISRVSYRFGARQSTSFNTEWNDVDFNRIVAMKVGNSTNSGRANHRAGSQGADFVVPPGTGGGSGGGGIPAKITAGGPGDTYTGDLYANGKAGGVTTADVSIVILQIDGDATIPTGTWLFVARVGDHYEGQVAVWL